MPLTEHGHMWFYPGGAFLWVLRSNQPHLDGEGHSKVYPKVYLQASFEVFLFMLGICWILTTIFTYDVIRSNRIKDVFGYNNVCVGFDMTPARYMAQPLMCLQAYFGIRYVTLDNLRAELEVREGRQRDRAYWFTKFVNTLYIITMLLWGMLLIVLPEGSSFTYHFYIYAIFVIIMYLTILANYFEEAGTPHITKVGLAWVIFFGIESLVLLLVGTVGFNGYDYDKCPNDKRQTFIDNGTYDDLCVQDPYIPIGLMATLDYGWFILLVAAPFLIPDSRPINYLIALAKEPDAIVMDVQEGPDMVAMEGGPGVAVMELQEGAGTLQANAVAEIISEIQAETGAEPSDQKEKVGEGTFAELPGTASGDSATSVDQSAISPFQQP